MMEDEHLHFLIDEEIYLLDDSMNAGVVDSKNEQKEPDEQASDYSEAPKTEDQAKSSNTIHFAVFHESAESADAELLQKIIDACKLPAGQYQIFSDGFDKEVSFEKALVFVSNAKVYYEAVKYKSSEILCSKPLHEIGQSQQEKVKLWKALQEFI